MREEQSENKMNRIDKYKYHVVKFLENPFQDTERVNCKDVCVPKSWVKWCSPEDNIVKVWYPTQDPGNTEKKVRKREKKSDQWESFLCVLKYSTDIYEEAKMYIQNKKYTENNNNEDNIPVSAKVEERPCKTTSSVTQNEATVENMLDAIGWSMSKSADTITLKRKASADSNKTTHRKRSRVNETGKSVDEVAGPSGQAFKNQTLTHKGSNEDLCIQETPVVKSNNRNSTEKKKNVNQNASKANSSLDPKSVDQLQIFNERFKLILKLQKCLDFPLPKEMIDKIINTDNSRSGLTDDTTASATSDATVQASKLNEKKRNEEPMEENDSDDDDDCGGDDDDINTDSSRSALINDTTASATSDATVQASKLNEKKRNEEPMEENDSDDDDDCGGDDDDINTDSSRSALTNDTIASPSNDTTVQASKLNEKKRNEEQIEENDCDDDDCSGDDDDINTDSSRSALTNDTIASASSEATVQASKFNAKKRNGEQIEENDSDDDDCENDSDDDNCENDYSVYNRRFNDSTYGDYEPRTKQKGPRQLRQLKTFILPPEYDANDSRWTLKYREPAPGLVELMVNSGVYVNATRLENLDKLTTNNFDFYRKLLSEVFTESALRTCSWTGKIAQGFTYPQGTNVRPGLDPHARQVLLDFAISNQNEVWVSNEFVKFFNKSMYSYMFKMRKTI